MASVSLVDDEVDASAALITALNAAGADVYAAFWMLDEETGVWAFHVASGRFDAEGRLAAYQLIRAALEETALLEVLPLHSIAVTSRINGAVQLLSTAIRATFPSRIRFTNNVINGVRIPDSLILVMDPPRPASPKRAVAKTRRTGLATEKSKAKKKKRK